LRESVKVAGDGEEVEEAGAVDMLAFGALIFGIGVAGGTVGGTDVAIVCGLIRTGTFAGWARINSAVVSPLVTQY
jgi:hypothetical protein